MLGGSSTPSGGYAIVDAASADGLQVGAEVEGNALQPLHG